MNAVKEEVAATTSTAVSVGRSTVSRAVAASAPSASARVATSSGAEILGVARSEAVHSIQVETQSILPNLSLVEGPILSSTLGRTTNTEAGTARSMLPELREQISQAAQQGFEGLMGDRVPQLEPSFSITETTQKIEEFIAPRSL
ncbi:hypothetical protein OPQ81_007740 [Rhizoctonia solani]|nr:hypothetical protein OPQ81_007740 [Rhizoctonia solani]